MKAFFDSKTNWVGIITFLISIVTYFQGLDWIQQNPKIVAMIGMVLGVLTIILRMLSTEKISGVFHAPITKQNK
jgi:SNF family Na+-dependent transporter